MRTPKPWSVAIFVAALGATAVGAAAHQRILLASGVIAVVALLTSWRWFQYLRYFPNQHTGNRPRDEVVKRRLMITAVVLALMALVLAVGALR